jgi:succinate-semialdehyde dehydrogenase / glutarate-semialdehyde dehydrogenase
VSRDVDRQARIHSGHERVHELKDPLLLRSQAFINGRYVGIADSLIRNPATGQEVGRVPTLGAEEANEAVNAAALAFRTWSRTTAKHRSGILRRWFDLVVSARDDLATILTSEQGKPLDEALAEIDHAASYMEFYAEEAKRVSGEVLASPWPDARITVLRQPLGVVAAITPWNFPAAMVTRKIAPALAAGCTAVLKPSPETPLSALALAELAKRAGVPPGVFNVVTGDAAAIGGVLTRHEQVRLVSFTGSTAVGRLLMSQSSSTIKKMALELGGNAPFIVFEDADIDAAVAGVIAAKFRNMGQTCVSANRIYVQAPIYDLFIRELASRAAALGVGDGFEPGVQQGPLISERATQKVEAHVADAVRCGAVVVTGGGRHALGRTFFQPTVLACGNSTPTITLEETFGPIAAVFSFDTEAEVIEKANATTGGLAAYFYTRDYGRITRVVERLEVGMVGVNAGRISTELAPFGGSKESGHSREGSHHGIQEFTELKYVCLGGVTCC